MLIKTYEGTHKYEVLDVCSATSNSFFASCGGDKQAFVTDVKTERVTHRLYGHSRRINSIDLNHSSGCSILGTASLDCTTALYDLRQRGDQPLTVLRNAKDSVTCVKLISSEAVCSSMDGRVYVYDLRNLSMVLYKIQYRSSSPVPPSDICANNLMITGDERCILVDCSLSFASANFLETALVLVNKSTGEVFQTYHEQHQIPGRTRYRQISCFDATEKYIFSGSRAKGSLTPVRCWETVSSISGLTIENQLAQCTIGYVSSLSSHPSEPLLLGSSHDSTCFMQSYSEN